MAIDAAHGQRMQPLGSANLLHVVQGLRLDEEMTQQTGGQRRQTTGVRQDKSPTLLCIAENLGRSGKVRNTTNTNARKAQFDQVTVKLHCKASNNCTRRLLYASESTFPCCFRAIFETVQQQWTNNFELLYTRRRTKNLQAYLDVEETEYRSAVLKRFRTRQGFPQQLSGHHRLEWMQVAPARGSRTARWQRNTGASGHVSIQTTHFRHRGSGGIYLPLPTRKLENVHDLGTAVVCWTST